jgi:hypothetical protein
MQPIRYCAAMGLVATFAVVAPARDEVLVPGDPPLTRSIADRKIEFWGWVVGQQPDEQRRAELRKLEVTEWERRDREWKMRWVRFLDAWQAAVVSGGDSIRLQGARAMALHSLGRPDSDAVGTSILATSLPPSAPIPPGRAPNFDGIQMQVLRMRQEQHNQMMRMLSDARARHHETMMTIIRNIGPSGRYEYNPSTGRYDRYVPYR